MSRANGMGDDERTVSPGAGGMYTLGAGRPGSINSRLVVVLLRVEGLSRPDWAIFRVYIFHDLSIFRFS